MHRNLDQKAKEFQALIPPKARQLLDILKFHNKEALIIGGAVRDFFFGHPIGDYDLATSAVPNQLIQWFEEAHIKTKSIGGSFGTVLAIVGKKEEKKTAFDVSTFRREHFPAPGQPPVVTFVDSLADDLARRDFTINAIVYDDSEKKIYDPYDGLRDIREGVIHIIGDPFIRFLEDGLRIIRICRFIAQFNLNPGEAAKKAVHTVGTQAVFRSRTVVRLEFFKLLKLPDPKRGLRLLFDAKVLKAIFPQIPLVSPEVNHPHLVTVFEKLGKIPARQPLLRLFSFLILANQPEKNTFNHWQVYLKNVTRDLNLNLKQQQVLRRIIRSWFFLPDFDIERQIQQWVRGTGINTSEDLLPAMFLSWEISQNERFWKRREEIKERITQIITNLRG